VEQGRPRDRLQAGQLTARRFLLVLLLASLALVGLVGVPLWQALFLAGVVAVVLAPLQRRLAARLGGRRKLAAGILVLLVLLLVVGPLLAMSAYAVKEMTEGVRFVLQTVRGEGVTGLIERLPEPFARLAAEVQARFGDLDALIQDQVGAQSGRAASALGAALAATGSALFQGAMMLIALFFLLVDGGQLLGWLVEVSPLRRGQTQELMKEFTKVAYAVLVSTAVTAAVQAAVALPGYLIARVPYALFFTGVTFFLALIPAVGAASVCLFAAFLLLVTGHPYMAAFLAAWGLLVVGLVDNVVKPYLIKGDIQMHGAVVFFALIGGIAAFGMIGLLAGPLAVALFLATLRIWRRDFIAHEP
jgi:predicted PurR-regulated permease PerM